MARKSQDDRHNIRSLERRGFIAIIALLLVAAGLLLATKAMEPKPTELRGDLTERFEEKTVIAYRGRNYEARSGLTSILLMGIDQNYTTTVDSFRNGGQADFLLLLVADAGQKKIVPIQIDRDTMTPIPVLGVLGNRAGTRTTQICLSHGFGDGKDLSCSLTAEAVSTFLLGQSIDFYIAMDLDGISALNDWIGGVTVTLEDDFTLLDPKMEKGKTLTLQGDQAEYFVRSRYAIGSGTNEERSKRQSIYLTALRKLLDARIQENANSIGSLFDALEPYLVTNMKRGRMINEAWATRQYEREDILKPEGTYEIGTDGFMEFHADEPALESNIMEIFYEADE